MSSNQCEVENTTEVEELENGEELEDGEEDVPELEDPQQTLREECKGKCESFQSRLDICNDRVSSRSSTTETCFEEVVDFMHCVDHCASEELFKFLK